MSKIKPKQAYAKQIFDGFGGISPQAALSGKGVTDLSNFRILSDGSLEKRCGWRTYATLPDTVRGVWQGTLGGVSSAFAVGGNVVYRLEDDGTANALSAISTSTGNVHFILYRDYLYLMDGTQIYVYRPTKNSFEVASGYAPLYGMNWHPTDYGDVYEPLNLFTGRMRVHYANTTGSTVFYFPYYAESVDQVRVDGRTVSDYSFTAPSDTVTLSSFGGSVEIAFTAAFDTDVRRSLRKCTHGFADRFGARDALMLYGAPQGQYLFCSASVDNNMLNSCKVAYDDADPLYFKANSQLTVGSPEHPITTLMRNHDRVLAFHTLGASSVQVSEESDTVECYTLLRGVGCLASGCDLTVDGDGVILNEGGVMRLSSTVSDPDEFTLTRLPTEIDALNDPDFLQSAIVCSDPSHSELWFRDPNDADGNVWVYHTTQKQSYRFAGIGASFFLSLNGYRGFAADNRICLFDETLSTDGGTAFAAICQSGYLSFGFPEELKRSLRLSLCLHSHGNPMEVRIESERKEKSYTVLGSAQAAPALFDLRTTLGRFRFLRVTLTDNGTARSRIYRLALYANL